MPKWFLIGLLALLMSIGSFPVTAQDDATPTITPTNAAQLQLLDRLGRGTLNGSLAQGPTPNTVIIPTTLGFYVWDYTQPDVEPRLIPTAEPMWGYISPDGQFIAARAENGTIYIWEVSTGNITLQRGLPPPQAIGSGGMQWAANSQALAVGTWDDTVSVFDPHTGESLAFYASGITIEVNMYVDAASLTSLSPDGTRIVWGNMGARVELRNVGGDQAINVNIAQRGGQVLVTAVAWSDDSRYVALSMSDSTIRVYDATTGELIKELDGTLGSALDAAWQPGTSTLQYSSGIHWWRWDATTDEFVGRIPTDGSGYVWSPDGTQLAVAGRVGVRILDAATGDTLHTLYDKDATSAMLEWSPNGAYLLMRHDGQTMHWNATTGEIVGGTAINGARWLGAGEKLTFYTPSTAQVWVVNAADGSTVATLRDFSQSAMRLFWGPTGLQLAQTTFGDGLTTIANAAGKILHQLVRVDEMSEYGFVETFSVVWSPDGARFATISPNGKVKIWTLDKAWPASPTILDVPDPNNLAFSPDGRLLVVTGWDNTARVYDATTYKFIVELTGFEEPSNAADFSSDGRYLAVGSYDRTVRVFDISTWEVVATLPNYNYTYAKPNLAFSPDGATLAYPNRASGLTLWNVATQTRIETTTDLFGSGESLAWSPDGALVAVGMYSGEIVVWDAILGQQLVILNEEINSWDYSRSVDTLLFSPDGTQLIIAGEDSTVQIWGIPTSD